MARRIPLLLNFYALSNGATSLVLGQVTSTNLSDLTFTNYNRRKTFRTLFRLYRTKPYSSQSIILNFETGTLTATTNKYGAFYVKDVTGIAGELKEVKLGDGAPVKIIDGLYETVIRNIDAKTMVVSDIDDTLMHSFIYRKVRKFQTLMFTPMEKRKAVTSMEELIRTYVQAGAQPVYLSNSEQNLYPIIYRFLQHNKFPPGPLFLKQLRSLIDVLLNLKFPLKNSHKLSVLEDLFLHFPERKFILMGDNTQQDMTIYLAITKKYPERVHSIIIRKVIDNKKDLIMIQDNKELLDTHNIVLHYSDSFPLYAQNPDQPAN